jgi:hypothetical protein
MRSVVPIDEQERASRGFPSHMITFGVLVSAVAGSIRGNQSLPPPVSGEPLKSASPSRQLYVASLKTVLSVPYLLRPRVTYK